MSAVMASKSDDLFKRRKQRFIALKILYFGWDYDGLAWQAESDKTVEYHLFRALTHTRLIESRENCKFSRCGRTDKGVSSHGQVVSLSVRSNLTDESDPRNVGLFSPNNYVGDVKQQGQELNYTDILNKVLPDYVKVIAWAPIRETFSARFNCKSRSYSYIFPKGDLDIEAMREGLSYLVGGHDFRNLCTFDLKNGVTNHFRTIVAASVDPLRSKMESSGDLGDSFAFFQIVITGQAFLYHQIRCIMTVIFLIGAKKEPPYVVRDLLDIEKCPAKPNYAPASPLPLCLFDCRYEPSEMPLGWLYDKQALENLCKQLKKLWCRFQTQALMIERSLGDIMHLVATCGDDEPEPSHKRPRLDFNRWKDFSIESDTMSDVKYVPLLSRQRDDTLESKLQALEAKKRETDK